MNDILNTIMLACAFLALFAIAELLYHKFKVKAELTRKFVHVGTGVCTLLFPLLLHDHWPVLLLCTSFAVILITSLKFNLLKSINAIGRKSYGSILYPVAVYGCYLAYEYYAKKTSVSSASYIYFYLPILTLAICDPAAALAGRAFPYGKYTIGKDTKTVVGSLSFFITSLVLTLLIGPGHFSGLPMAIMLLQGMLIAIVATIIEALSGSGVDNITIPAGVLLLLALLR